MSEDTTGDLTDGSITAMSSLMSKVLPVPRKHIHIVLCRNYSFTDILIPFTGKTVSVYRKSHLFDVELPEKGVSLKESAFTISGPSLVAPVQTPIGKVTF